MIILLILVFIITLTVAIWPEIGWHLRHVLHVRSGEPAESSLIAIRIGGAVLAAIAAFFLMVEIVM